MLRSRLFGASVKKPVMTSSVSIRSRLFTRYVPSTDHGYPDGGTTPGAVTAPANIEGAHVNAFDGANQVANLNFQNGHWSGWVYYEDQRVEGMGPYSYQAIGGGMAFLSLSLQGEPPQPVGFITLTFTSANGGTAMSGDDTVSFTYSK